MFRFSPLSLSLSLLRLIRTLYSKLYFHPVLAFDICNRADSITRCFNIIAFNLFAISWRLAAVPHWALTYPLDVFLFRTMVLDFIVVHLHIGMCLTEFI